MRFSISPEDAPFIVARAPGRGATLDELVRDLVAPYASGASAPSSGNQRFSVAGPLAWLTSDAALALALVLHELATNAAKHGALSSSEGRVLVAWGTDVTLGDLWLSWTETGGPHVSGAPTWAGFGTRLIDLTIRRQLGGSLDWGRGEEGLTFKFTVLSARALASK